MKMPSKQTRNQGVELFMVATQGSSTHGRSRATLQRTDMLQWDVYGYFPSSYHVKIKKYNVRVINLAQYRKPSTKH